MVTTIAHRGASAVEPENTLRAFDRAIRMGAQMIEMDLQAAADGRVVVCHDPPGRVIPPEVPTLEETLELTRGRIRLYLEIKARAAARRTLEIVREFGCEDEVMLASFDLGLMKGLAREVKNMEIGLIMQNLLVYRWVTVRNYEYQTLCMGVRGCTQSLIRHAHRRGKKVYAWTANSLEEYARLTERGIDGICTDHPDRLISFLNSSSLT